MILIINTIDRHCIEIGLFKNNRLESFNFKTLSQSDDLLVAIEGIIKLKKISLQNIKAILVNQGPGSFTGVRLGITCANTLAWILDIPVFGYIDDNLDKTLKRVWQIKIKKFSRITLPYYQ